MRRDQRRKPLLSYHVQQFIEDDACRGFVKVAGRFVREQYLRCVGKSTGNGNALLLATGKFAGQVGLARLQPEGAEQSGSTIGGLSS